MLHGLLVQIIWSALIMTTSEFKIGCFKSSDHFQSTRMLKLRLKYFIGLGPVSLFKMNQRPLLPGEFLSSLKTLSTPQLLMRLMAANLSKGFIKPWSMIRSLVPGIFLNRTRRFSEESCDKAPTSISGPIILMTALTQPLSAFRDPI